MSDKGRMSIEIYTDNCTGCGVCVYKCPSNAIAMEENIEGFLYPRVNKDVCVGCGKCVESCTLNLNRALFNHISSGGYVGEIKNKDILLDSSSGGAFSGIVEAYKPDIIYGMCWRGNEVVCESATINDYSKLRKSKYIQAKMADVYLRIKSDIQEGKRVLFCGVPCQIAAVISFFGEKPQSLFFLEIVCHGVASPGFLKEYIAFKEKQQCSRIVNIEFRKKDKRLGDWEFFNTVFTYENGKIEKNYRDPFMWLFLERYILRKCCGKCIYSREERLGDVVVGDYWGCKELKPKYYNKFGVSFIIPLSDLGISVIKDIKSMKLNEVTSDIIKANNKALYRSIPLADGRQLLFERISKASMKELLDEFLPKETLKHRIKILLHKFGVIR